MGLTRRPSERSRLESPHFIEIGDPSQRITILTGGLPYHRRCGMRMLDSLLIAAGESQRRFRIGIGLDLPQPAAAAIDLLAPATCVYPAAIPKSAATGWLFHLSARNVMTTHVAPLIEAGQVVGFRARLLETFGQPTKLHVSAFRPIASARQLDLCGAPLEDIDVTDGKAEVPLGAYEWMWLEARWEQEMTKVE